MSGGIINQAALDRYARDPSIEIRRTNDAVVTQTGSVGGRLVRNLAITFGSGPTTAEKAAIMGAKRQTLAELKATFGDDIGERAFRAHIGKSDGRGGWITSAAHPITGRHVTAMIRTAQQEMAARYDDSRMRQISIGGMAGPFSKGVCKAATMDWFRRIDNGQPTWRHEAGRQLDRNGIDWEAKRARLQTIQDRGQSADPLNLFDRQVYMPQQLYHAQISGGRVGLDKGNEFANQLFDSARRRFSDETTRDDPNQFWQLNVDLAGRIHGSVGHAIGIHVTRVPDRDTGTAADFRVHVFDANEREAVDIPGEQFGAWLSSHLTDRYGDRVKSMMLTDVIKQALPNEGAVDRRGQSASDDFSMENS